MIADNILEIENLFGRYLHCLYTSDWKKVGDMFSRHPDVSYQISPVRRPIIGYENIMRDGYRAMDEVFTEYAGYHTGGQTGAPLIEISPCGTRAWAQFPSFGFLIKGKAFGNLEPPFPLSAAIGMWCPEFIKEDGTWKIFKFHAPTLIEQTIWQWDSSTDDGLAAQGKVRDLPYPPEPKTIFENKNKLEVNNENQ